MAGLSSLGTTKNVAAGELVQTDKPMPERHYLTEKVDTEYYEFLSRTADIACAWQKIQTHDSIFL